MKKIFLCGFLVVGGIAFAQDEGKKSDWTKNIDWNQIVDYVAEQLKITKDQAVDALKGFSSALKEGKPSKDYWNDWAKKNNKTLPQNWYEELKNCFSQPQK